MPEWIRKDIAQIKAITPNQRLLFVLLIVIGLVINYAFRPSL